MEHGRRIARQAEQVWGWASPAGRVRRDRRVDMLARGAGLALGTRALELGCGTGEFTAGLLETGAVLVALDLSADLLERARERTGRNIFVVADATRLPFRTSSFAAVVGSSVLHHVDLDEAS